jgi:chemotaxis family two-component system response regulator Rcp1
MRPKLQILIAEDNLGDVLLVRRALDAHGVEYDLHAMRDGVAAAVLIERVGSSTGARCPDLFLFDLNLPKVDGYDLLVLLRAHPVCGDKPVIIMSSSGAEKDRRRAMDAGATRYYQKPSDLKEFMKLGALVREVVEAALPLRRCKKPDQA